MLRAAKLKRSITALARALPAKASLELSRSLHELYEADPAEYRQLVGQGVLSRRRAYYLLSVGELLSRMNIPDERLSRIGWTKLSVIAHRLTRENANKQLDLAEENNVRELKRLVSGAGAQRRRCVLMYFTDAQYREFKRALLVHGATSKGRGLANMEQATLRLIQSRKVASRRS